MVEHKGKKPGVDEVLLRSQKLQRRWRKLQDFARDIYRSELNDAQLDVFMQEIRMRLVRGFSGVSPAALSEEREIE